MSFYESFKSLLNFNDDTQEEEQPQPQQPVEEKPFYKRPMTWIVGIGSFLLVRSAFSGEKRYTIRGSMYLTKNFRVGEFLRSSSIPELKEYKLTKDELSNLRRLAVVLQRIRDDIGAPVIITSGGRPPGMVATHGKYAGMNFVEILKAKNYSPSEFSQHMDFSAADWTTQDKRWLPTVIESMTNVVFADAMGKTITQVILYIENGIPDFIHLGVRSDIHDFNKITAGKRLLLAEVTSWLDNGVKKRKTKYHSFTKEKMDELVK